MTPITTAIKKHFAEIGFRHDNATLQNAVRCVYCILEDYDGDVELAVRELYPASELQGIQTISSPNYFNFLFKKKE